MMATTSKHHKGHSALSPSGSCPSLPVTSLVDHLRPTEGDVHELRGVPTWPSQLGRYSRPTLLRQNLTTPEADSEWLLAEHEWSDGKRSVFGSSDSQIISEYYFFQHSGQKLADIAASVRCNLLLQPNSGMYMILEYLDHTNPVVRKRSPDSTSSIVTPRNRCMILKGGSLWHRHKSTASGSCMRNLFAWTAVKMICMSTIMSMLSGGSLLGSKRSLQKYYFKNPLMLETRNILVCLARKSPLVYVMIVFQGMN